MSFDFGDGVLGSQRSEAPRTLRQRHSLWLSHQLRYPSLQKAFSRQLSARDNGGVGAMIEAFVWELPLIDPDHRSRGLIVPIAHFVNSRATATLVPVTLPVFSFCAYRTSVAFRGSAAGWWLVADSPKGVAAVPKGCHPNASSDPNTATSRAATRRHTTHQDTFVECCRDVISSVDCGIVVERMIGAGDNSTTGRARSRWSITVSIRDFALLFNTDEPCSSLQMRTTFATNCPQLCGSSISISTNSIASLIASRAHLGRMRVDRAFSRKSRACLRQLTVRRRASSLVMVGVHSDLAAGHRLTRPW